MAGKLKFSIQPDPIAMLKFKNLAAARDEVINNTMPEEITGRYIINDCAKNLHPDYQQMKVVKVADHDKAGAKSYFLKKTDVFKAAPFRAGQYVSVFLEINGSVVTRPYSISSSPLLADDATYAITVRRTDGGFVSEWILDNWKAGDVVTVSAPMGNFYHESLRDSSEVVAVAGGSGITPFLSMAYAIRDGKEDFNMTILYGSRTYDSILLKNELDEICAATPKVRVIYVLSDEQHEGCENGFIGAELISKYAPCALYSLFICGPEAMYRYLEGEIGKLGLPSKYIRREMMGVTKLVSAVPGYPAECVGQFYNVRVFQGSKDITVRAYAGEPLLVALERAGIAAPSRCRSGECGYCRTRLVEGSVFTPAENDYRRYYDKKTRYIHLCAAFPISDVIIEVPGVYC